MTDPTPTRAEVERLRLIYGNITASPSGPYVRFTDYEALRERAEAAEQARDQWMLTYHNVRDTLNEDLIEARRAEAAAWNDAIEAGWAYIETCLDEPETDADAALISDMEEGFRALRRAAPTEGEA